MYELIFKLILAHLLGDFVFQSTKMVNDIKRKRFKSGQLYIHALIHLVLLLVVTKAAKPYLFPVFLLALSHLMIDILTKLVIKKGINPFQNLLLDQLLHFIAIALFVNHFYPYSVHIQALFNEKNYLLCIALIVISQVASVFIRKIMEVFHYSLPKGGIRDAGKYIGILERLFVFVFVVISFWEGIGFLLAAKSIFRFGDLKENKEIRLTEYILIGTLLSFGIAIFTGLLYLKLISLL